MQTLYRLVGLQSVLPYLRHIANGYFHAILCKQAVGGFGRYPGKGESHDRDSFVSVRVIKLNSYRDIDLRHLERQQALREHKKAALQEKVAAFLGTRL
jgi:hypothetical protein